jgi:hypothetical protein
LAIFLWYHVLELRPSERQHYPKIDSPRSWEIHSDFYISRFSEIGNARLPLSWRRIGSVEKQNFQGFSLVMQVKLAIHYVSTCRKYTSKKTRPKAQASELECCVTTPTSECSGEMLFLRKEAHKMLER